MYLTPAFQASLTKTWLHRPSYALFLFSGLHHWWPVVGGTPSHWNLAYPVRAAYLFALVPLHALLRPPCYEPSRVMFDELQAGPGGLSATQRQRDDCERRDFTEAVAPVALPRGRTAPLTTPAATDEAPSRSQPP